MDVTEIQNSVALRNALVSAFRQHGMRLLPDSDMQVLALLQSKGVTLNVSESGYLELRQGSTLMVLSNAFETLRKENPELFVSDPRRDAIASREDFRGSPSEIAAAKSRWIGQHGPAAWERLPRTRAEAELHSAVPSADMTRKEYLSLPFAERVQLSGALGPDALSKIMARTR
jgi:hypothetical protein